MNILIIGGTGFFGRHLVESALARGHVLTLFHRGRRASDLFPGVEQVIGDRTDDLALLQGRRWDAVIDTCGYVPRVVRASAEALAGAAERYIFISSISVYADFSRTNIDENASVARLADESVEEITDETYGALKALCEQATEQVFPGRALIIRPGLIVGPHDFTDRFTYWPHRVAQGGEMLAPGRPEDPTQFIDVRDLADWTIQMVKAGKTGIYNATGPDYALSMGRLLEESRAVTGSDAQFTWVDEDFLLKHNVDLPLWAPPSQYAGFSTVNCRKALVDGLTFRPLAETIRDTLAWKGEHPLRGGLSREQEASLLKEWKEAQHTPSPPPMV